MPLQEVAGPSFEERLRERYRQIQERKAAQQTTQQVAQQPQQATPPHWSDNVPEWDYSALENLADIQMSPPTPPQTPATFAQNAPNAVAATVPAPTFNAPNAVAATVPAPTFKEKIERAGRHIQQAKELPKQVPRESQFVPGLVRSKKQPGEMFVNSDGEIVKQGPLIRVEKWDDKLDQATRIDLEIQNRRLKSLDDRVARKEQQRLQRNEFRRNRPISTEPDPGDVAERDSILKEKNRLERLIESADFRDLKTNEVPVYGDTIPVSDEELAAINPRADWKAIRGGYSDVSEDVRDKTKEILRNLNQRGTVLDIWRNASDEEKEQIRKAAPGIGKEIIANERGGFLERLGLAGAVGRGFSGIAQPIMETIGVGGTKEEIAAMRHFQEIFNQTAAPVLPSDPWYERSVLGGAEMAPAAIMYAAGGAAGGAIAKGLGATSKLALGAGKIAGMNTVGFVPEYVGARESLGSAGVTGWTKELGAIATSLGVNTLEGIIPNPFPSFGPIKEGLGNALRNYAMEAAKKYPGELSEEFAQGFFSGAAKVAATWLDENASDLEYTEPFKESFEQGSAAALPLLSMIGIPFAGKAGYTAVKPAVKAVADKLPDYVRSARKWAEKYSVPLEDVPSRAGRQEAHGQEMEQIAGIAEQIQSQKETPQERLREGRFGETGPVAPPVTTPVTPQQQETAVEPPAPVAETEPPAPVETPVPADTTQETPPADIDKSVDIALSTRATDKESSDLDLDILELEIDRFEALHKKGKLSPDSLNGTHLAEGLYTAERIGLNRAIETNPDAFIARLRTNLSERQARSDTTQETPAPVETVETPSTEGSAKGHWERQKANNRPGRELMEPVVLEEARNVVKAGRDFNFFADETDERSVDQVAANIEILKDNGFTVGTPVYDSKDGTVSIPVSKVKSTGEKVKPVEKPATVETPAPVETPVETPAESYEPTDNEIKARIKKVEKTVHPVGQKNYEGVDLHKRQRDRAIQYLKGQNYFKENAKSLIEEITHSEFATGKRVITIGGLSDVWRLTKGGSWIDSTGRTIFDLDADAAEAIYEKYDDYRRPKDFIKVGAMGAGMVGGSAKHMVVDKEATAAISKILEDSLNIGMPKKPSNKGKRMKFTPPPVVEDTAEAPTTPPSKPATPPPLPSTPPPLPSTPPPLKKPATDVPSVVPTFMPKTGDALPDVISKMKNEKKLSPEQESLWNQLETILASQNRGMPSLEIIDNVIAPKGKKWIGKYNPAEHSMQVRSDVDSKLLPLVLLHEAVHAATRQASLIHKAGYVPGVDAEVSKASRDAYDRLNHITNEIKGILKSKNITAKDVGLPGDVVPVELIAEAFTNARFRKFLAENKMLDSDQYADLRGKSLLEAFIDYVTRVLGLKGDSVTALEEVLGLSATIMQEDVKPKKPAKPKGEKAVSESDVRIEDPYSYEIADGNPHPHINMVPKTGPVKIVCIGCGNQKQKSGLHKGKDLYTSDYFKQHREYAEKSGKPWIILSAEHGMVDPEVYYKPYDNALKGSRAEQNRFGQSASTGVFGHLQRAIGVDVKNRDIEFEVLAGAAYADSFERFAGKHAKVEKPMQGMEIGERNSWIRNRNKEAVPQPVKSTGESPAATKKPAKGKGMTPAAEAKKKAAAEKQAAKRKAKKQLKDAGVVITETKAGWSVIGLPKEIGDGLRFDYGGGKPAKTGRIVFKKDPTQGIEEQAGEIAEEARLVAAASARGLIRRSYGEVTPEEESIIEERRQSRLDREIKEIEFRNDEIEQLIGQFVGKGRAKKSFGKKEKGKISDLRKEYHKKIKEAHEGKDANAIKNFDYLTEYVSNPDFDDVGFRSSTTLPHETTELLALLSKDNFGKEKIDKEAMLEEIDAEMQEDIEVMIDERLSLDEIASEKAAALEEEAAAKKAKPKKKKAKPGKMTELEKAADDVGDLMMADVGDGDAYFDPKKLDALREDSGSYKSRSLLIYMTPDEFLQMSDALETPDPNKAKRVQDAMETGSKFADIPYLFFDESGADAKVTGHEGRHRAMALRDAGVSQMPVEFRGHIRWSEQNKADNFDREKVWPSRLIGQSSGSIPFPVSDPLDDVGDLMMAEKELDPEVVAGLQKVASEYVVEFGVDSKFEDFIEWATGKFGEEKVNRREAELKEAWDARTPKPKAAPTQDGDTTGTKNVKTAEMREKAGLVPREIPMPEEVQGWLDEAIGALAADQSLGFKLAEEIDEKPRILSEREEAIFAVHLRELESRRQSGEDVLDEILTAVRASEKAGTKWGRSGVARQMELYSDFSLAGMVRQHERTVKNAPTKSQAEEYAKKADEIKTLQAKHDQMAIKVLQAETDAMIAREAERAAKQALADSKRTPSKPRLSKGTKREKLQKQAVAAVSRFMGMFKSTEDGDPKMADTDNDQIREAAKEVVATYRDMGVKTGIELVNRIKADGATITSEQAEILRMEWDKLKVSPLPDDPTDKQIGSQVREITRSVIESDPDYYLVSGKESSEVAKEKRDNLLEDVRTELKRLNITLGEEETMIAIGGYGDFREISKEDVDVAMRGYRGEFQKVMQIIDMKRGIAPRATGVEQRDPTAAELALTKEVNEMKKEGNFQTVGRSLKSALETAKTVTNNRIQVLREAIEDRKRINRKKKNEDTDEELEDLIAEKEQLQAEYNEMFPPNKAKPLSEGKKLELAKKMLRRQISEVIPAALGSPGANLGRKKRPKPVTDAEKESLQSQLKALKEARDELREADPVFQAEEAARWIENRKKALDKQLMFWATRREEASRGILPKKPQPKNYDTDELRQLRYDVEVVKRHARAEMENARRQELGIAGKILSFAGDLLDFSRGIMTSGEDSGVLRQGAFYTLGYPRQAIPAIRDSFRAALSRQVDFSIHENLMRRDNHLDYLDGKMETTVADGPLSHREEMMRSRIASLMKDLPLLSLNPLNPAGRVIGEMMLASERAFRAYSNTMRADLFDNMKANTEANRAGTTLESKIAKAIGIKIKEGKWSKDDSLVVGNATNIFSGRPSLKGSEGWSRVFYAPRWVWSRAQLIVGVPAWKGDAATRMAVAKVYVRAALGMAAFQSAKHLYYSWAADDDDEKPRHEFDWRSSDLMKTVIGDTRLDSGTGLNQLITLFGRVYTGETKRQDGTIVKIRGEDAVYGADGVRDIFHRMLDTKLAPFPSAVLDYAAGENVVGEKATLKKVIGERLMPMTWRDIWAAEQELNVKQGTVAAIEAFFGTGLSTYGDKTKYRKSNDEERKEMFEADVKQVQWDSPPPEYGEMLSSEQADQWNAAKQKKKISKLLDATTQRPHHSLKNYNGRMDQRDASIEAFKQIMLADELTLTDSKELLKAHYRAQGISSRALNNETHAPYKAKLKRLREIYRNY